jgi:hypothetical protein
MKAPGRPRKKEPELFINRELSWLEFNSRVLEEAMDPSTPLLDRLKLAIIVSTNLDEFFMVRVAALKHAVAEGDNEPDLAGLRPRQQRHVIAERAHEMVDTLGRTLTEQILPALAEHAVRIVPLATLEEAQRTFLSRYFRAEVLPALTPLATDASRPFPAWPTSASTSPSSSRPATARSSPGWPSSRSPAACGGWCGRWEARAAPTCSWKRSSAPSSPSCSPARPSWHRRPFVLPATRRWSWTTRAAAHIWKPSRRS